MFTPALALVNEPAGVKLMLLASMANRPCTWTLATEAVVLPSYTLSFTAALATLIDSGVYERHVRRGRRENERRRVAVTPHELRHAYATHLLNRGANIKALSEAMGHAQIETTAGYCHAEALSVGSPLELVT